MRFRKVAYSRVATRKAWHATQSVIIHIHKCTSDESILISNPALRFLFITDTWALPLTRLPNTGISLEEPKRTPVANKVQKQVFLLNQMPPPPHRPHCLDSMRPPPPLHHPHPPRHPPPQKRNDEGTSRDVFWTGQVLLRSLCQSFGGCSFFFSFFLINTSVKPITDWIYKGLSGATTPTELW